MLFDNILCLIMKCRLLLHSLFVVYLLLLKFLFVAYLPRMAKKAETCRRIAPCLYLLLSNRSAVVGIYMMMPYHLY